MQDDELAQALDSLATQLGALRTLLGKKPGKSSPGPAAVELDLPRSTEPEFFSTEDQFETLRQVIAMQREREQEDREKALAPLTPKSPRARRRRTPRSSTYRPSSGGVPMWHNGRRILRPDVPPTPRRMRKPAPISPLFFTHCQDGLRSRSGFSPTLPPSE